MKTIYLVRHCKAEGQAPDARLTEEGLRQAEQFVRFFEEKPIDRIVSSPYERAVSSVRPLSVKRSVPIHTDSRLSERVLSLEARADWMERLKESFHDLDRKLPGGESSNEAMQRGVSVINDLLGHPGHEHIVVVTHGNLMSLILKRYDDSVGYDLWKGLSNPDVYELSFPEMKDEAGINRVWVISYPLATEVEGNHRRDLQQFNPRE